MSQRSQVFSVRPEPAEGFVVSNGVRLQYLDWGGVGDPLIFIHGVTDNPYAFDDLAGAFTDRFRVLAYARRSHGKSDVRGPYDTETLTRDLSGFMDALRLERAHLAGWSMGGNEITHLAGQESKRVETLVYLDGAYDWADPEFQLASSHMPASLLETPTDARASFQDFLAFQKAQNFTGVSNIQQLESYFRANVSERSDGSLTLVMEELETSLMEALTTAAPRDYQRVEAPALAIYAASLFDLNATDPVRRRDARAWEQRYMVPFRQHSIERVTAELRNLRLVMTPGTHNDFMITCRDQVVREMRSFLLDPH